MIVTTHLGNQIGATIDHGLAAYAHDPSIGISAIAYLRDQIVETIKAHEACQHCHPPMPKLCHPDRDRPLTSAELEEKWPNLQWAPPDDTLVVDAIIVPALADPNNAEKARQARP